MVKTTVPDFDLVALRKATGLSQKDMARRMGLGARVYFDIEADQGPMNIRHRMLAERALMDIAAEQKDPMLMPAPTRRLVLYLAQLITG